MKDFCIEYEKIQSKIREQAVMLLAIEIPLKRFANYVL